jgi:hypothetical protein
MNVNIYNWAFAWKPWDAPDTVKPVGSESFSATGSEAEERVFNFELVDLNDYKVVLLVETAEGWRIYRQTVKEIDITHGYDFISWDLSKDPAKSAAGPVWIIAGQKAEDNREPDAIAVKLF